MMRADEEYIIRHYYDTVIRTVTDTVVRTEFIPDSTAKQREVVIPTDSTDRRGHYIQAHVGLGYGSLGYQLDGADNRVNGSFSALLQLQYAYYFHQNWGVGVGLWFTNYTSFAHIGGDYQWKDQTDTDYELHYDHTASVKSWRERETIHNLGIPISLQFQMRKEDWKAGIFAALGVAPSFSVSKKYKVVEGVIDHSGYYPAWDLTLTDMHEFGKKDYKDAPQSKGQLSVRPQATFFADLGALIPLTKQIDLLVGGYFNISMNNANSSDKADLGWKDDTFTFMNEYKGAYATTLANGSHPWEAGVKVGIHWHYIAPDKHTTENFYEPFMRPDTSYRYIPRADTTIVVVPDPIVEQEPAPEIVEVAQEVEKFNKVYFEFDSYELTDASKAYLSSIVDALNRVSKAKISLEGHASEEGEAVYNDRLSERRAKAVRDYLVEHGLNGERIVTKGHGSRVPNEEKEYAARKRDRRVEIQVIVNENK